MEIEIVEFYPKVIDKTRGFLMGTLHVYSIDKNLDIRGMHLIRNKDKWKVSMPSRVGTDPETNEAIRYPLVDFIDKDYKRRFMKEVLLKAKEYVRQNFIKKKREPGVIPPR